MINLREEFKRISFTFTRGDRILIMGCIFLLSIVCALCIYIAHCDYEIRLEHISTQTAKGIDRSLNGILERTSDTLRQLGKRIIEVDSTNLNEVQRLLEEFDAASIEPNEELKQALSWTRFEWNPVNSPLSVNQRVGILNPSQAKYKFIRDYVPKVEDRPWILYLSPPDIAKISNIWAIPAGYGISKNGKFLGFISMGLNIVGLNELLIKEIQKDMSKDAISFIILDRHKNIILKSTDNALSDRSDHFKKILEGLNPFSESDGVLKNPLKQNSFRYNYYRKMDDFPYTILIGRDINATLKHILVDTAFSLGMIFCIMLIILFMFYMHRKEYTQTAFAANKEKQKIIQKTIKQLQNDIELIYQHSNALLKYYCGGLKTQVSNENKAAIISRIRDAALSLQQFSVINFEMCQVNIEKLIKEVIIIHSHSAFVKNIRLEKEIKDEIPLFYANEQGLKQILIGLTANALESIPTGGYLKVCAFVEHQASNKFLNIIITDDGFQLSEVDIHRISEKLTKTNSMDADLIRFDMETIKNLINFHNGTLIHKDLSVKGKITTLKFPYLTSNHNPIPTIEDIVYVSH